RFPPGNRVIISGTVQGGNVEGNDFVSKGQPVRNAIVFLKGVPEIFARTNAKGKFTLETIVVPDSDPELIAYYPVYNEESDAPLLQPTLARFAATTKLKANTLAEPVTVTLNHGRRAMITLVEESGEAIKDCELRIMGMGHHVVITAAEDKDRFETDDLP